MASLELRRNWVHKAKAAMASLSCAGALLEALLPLLLLLLNVAAVAVADACDCCMHAAVASRPFGARGAEAVVAVPSRWQLLKQPVCVHCSGSGGVTTLSGLTLGFLSFRLAVPFRAVLDCVSRSNS